MLHYIVKRSILLVITLGLLSIFIFLLTHILPGDVAVMVLGTRASSEKVETLQHQLGLDQPLYLQYCKWVGGFLTGDWGKSLAFGDPVIKLISERFFRSAYLALSSITIAMIIAIPLGVVAAANQNRFQDFLATNIAILGVSLPNFLWGMILILVFAKFLKLFPPSGYVDPFKNPIVSLYHIILPSVTLGFSLMAYLTRMTRSTLLEVLRSEYVTTAYAKGLTERVVIYKHALKNAVLPVLTILGFQFAFLFGGVLIIEELFAFPGLGRLTLQAIFYRDIPLIQASVFIIGGVYMVSNLITDLLYTCIDPRIRYEPKE